MLAARMATSRPSGASRTESPVDIRSRPGARIGKSGQDFCAEQECTAQKRLQRFPEAGP